MANRKRKYVRRLLPQLNHEELTYYLPKIEALLKTTSYANPLKSYEICQLCGIERPRMMKIINKLRREMTLPICSGSVGYYLATTPEELCDMVESLEHRRNVIKAAEDGLKQMMQDMITGLQHQAEVQGIPYNIPQSILRLNGLIP